MSETHLQRARRVFAKRVDYTSRDEVLMAILAHLEQQAQDSEYVPHDAEDFWQNLTPQEQAWAVEAVTATQSAPTEAAPERPLYHDGYIQHTPSTAAPTVAEAPRPVVVCPKCGCVMDEYRAREKGYCYACVAPLKDVATTLAMPTETASERAQRMWREHYNAQPSRITKRGLMVVGDGEEERAMPDDWLQGSVPPQPAPAQHERWEKVMHYRRFGVRGWTIECGGQFIAECDFEEHADRIIADHERAGQVEALEALIRDGLSLKSGAMTFYEWQDKASAALDATAKGAD